MAISAYKRFNTRNGCLLAVVGLIGLTLFLAYVLSSVTLVNRSRPGSVAHAFLIALMRNDAEAAKSLVSADNRSRIEEWISTHQPLSCSRRDWDTGSSVGGVSLPDGYWQYHTRFQCADAEAPYCFSVDDILLEKTDDIGWQIIDWQVTCEERDYCGLGICP